MAVARDFHRAGRVVAVVAAILLAFIHQAVARRGAHFFFSSAMTHASFWSTVSSRAADLSAGLSLTEDHTPASVAA